MQTAARNGEIIAQGLDKQVFIFFFTYESWRWGFQSWRSVCCLSFRLCVFSAIICTGARCLMMTSLLCIPAIGEDRGGGAGCQRAVSAGLPLYTRDSSNTTGKPSRSVSSPELSTWPLRPVTGHGNEKTMLGLAQFVLWGWGRGAAPLINTFGFCD